MTTGSTTTTSASSAGNASSPAAAPSSGHPSPRQTPAPASSSPATAGNLTPPAKTPAPQQGGGEPAAEKKPFEALKRKLKIDNDEFELEIPDEATLDRYLQQGIAGNKRFHDAAKIRKEADKLSQDALKKLADAEAKEKRYQEDFLQAAIADAEASGDPEKMAQVRARVEKWLAQEIRKEMMTPEQRMLELERQKRERAEKTLAERDNEAKQKADADAEAHYAQEYEKFILTGLQSKGIPKTERAVKAMADMLDQALDRGYTLRPDQLAEFVRQDYIEDVSGLTSDIAARAKEAQAKGDLKTVVECGDEIIQMFGEDLVNLIRRADIARIRTGQPSVPKPVLETPRTLQGKEEPQKKTYMTDDEYAAWRKKRIEALNAGQPLPE